MPHVLQSPPPDLVRLSRDVSFTSSACPPDAASFWATKKIALTRDDSSSGDLTNEVRRLISSSLERPELIEDGTGGVYMIRESLRESSCFSVTQEGSCYLAEQHDFSSEDCGSSTSSNHMPLAIFKPSDEEVGSDNNPRGYVGQKHVMREGFAPGGGAVRERVAYKLDRGFAGVPRTVFEKLLLPSNSGRLREQSGSIQQYIASMGDASDFKFDGSDFQPRQSQQLALLDCRLFNCDRHEGNILVQDRSQARCILNQGQAQGDNESEVAADARLKTPVPIDHAFCLPRFGFFREAEFVWRYWLSSNQPFSAEATKYVADIDLEDDVLLAKASGLDDAACATLRVTTMLLKHALLGRKRVCEDTDEFYDQGGSLGGSDSEGEKTEVTPHDLAMLFMRKEFDLPSPLEVLCSQALGLPEEKQHHDTGLITYVTEQQAQQGQSALDFVPPSDFYDRLALLLEDNYGTIH